MFRSAPRSTEPANNASSSASWEARRASRVRLTERSTSTATATNVTEANAVQEQETAEAAVAAAPVFNNCGATDLVRPDRLIVDCENQDDERHLERPRKG